MIYMNVPSYSISNILCSKKFQPKKGSLFTEKEGKQILMEMLKILEVFHQFYTCIEKSSVVEMSICLLFDT